MKIRNLLDRVGLSALLLSTLNSQLTTAHAQGTAFTYQGVLSQGGAAVNGSNDLTFTLFNAVGGGATVGPSNVVNDLVISNGLFTVTLDFGAGAFDGTARWLQIAARPGASTGAYTNLAPRTPITPTPYAIFANTASNLSGALPTAALSGTYGGVVNFSNAANRLSGIGSNLTALNASQLTSGTVPTAALGNAWRITGNSNTTPGLNFIGTTDNQPLELKVNNQRGLRLEYQDSVLNQSVNVIGGYSSNQVSPGVVGATIAGGGTLNFLGGSVPNRVTADLGTVGGGSGNTASGFGATVGGGGNNTASGENATVPGGASNTATNYAFAAGNRAKANHQGAFVWADSQNADFPSTANNQFLIRAAGGVGIGTPSPLTTLDVRSTTPAITVGNSADEDGALYFGNPGHGVKRAYSGGNDVGLYTTAADLYLSANGTATSEFVLKNNGNVGIGTSAPGTKLQVAGTVTATGFSGNGSGLNGIVAAQIPNLDAAKIASGSLADARLSANVALRSGGNTFSGQQIITGGNLGIRATNPMGSIGYPGGWEGLHVQSPTGNGLNIIQGLSTARLHLRADNNITNVAQDFIIANGANKIDFTWLGSGLGTRLLAMTIATNGNVGIAGEVTTTAVNLTSDRNAKEQFKPVNAREVLAKVVGLPITEWQYKTQSDARHIGPMAQDFRQAFALGRDDKHITSVDADGVALAAIQGLNEKVEEKDARIQELEKSVAALKELVTKLARQQAGGDK